MKPEEEFNNGYLAGKSQFAAKVLSTICHDLPEDMQEFAEAIDMYKQTHAALIGWCNDLGLYPDPKLHPVDIINRYLRRELDRE